MTQTPPNSLDSDGRPCYRVTVIGPVPPIRSGISQHTGKLVETLRKAGHGVTVLSWASQYPKRLYKSRQRDEDIAPPSCVRFILRWWAPWTWVRAGLLARRGEVLIIPWVHPVQAVALRVVAWAAGRTPTVGVIHNVLPHERLAWDVTATRLFLSGIDVAVTQTMYLAQEVDKLQPGIPVKTAAHPPNIDLRPQTLPTDSSSKLLFLGYVRPYKGLDLLLLALALLRRDHPEISLTVAGEFWDPTPEELQLKVNELGLTDVVLVRPGYVSDDELPDLLGRHHLVIAPYQHATQSGIVPLAHSAQRPIVVTPVGGLPEQVRDGIDGIVAEGVDPDSLAVAIDRGLHDLDTLVLGTQDSSPSWEEFARIIIDSVDVTAEGDQVHLSREPTQHPRAQAFSRWAEALGGMLQRRARPLSRRAERIALLSAVVVFLSAAIIAFLNLPDRDRDIGWLPIVAAGVIGVPITLYLNALEYQASGAALGHRIGILQSLKVTIVGSAANLLPIPGSVIVRIRALSGMGSTYTQAVSVSAAIGGLYVGVTILIAGLLQMPAGEILLGGLWMTVGTFGVVVGYVLLRPHAAAAAPRLAVRVIAIEACLVLTGALRLLLVLMGLGFTAGVSQVVALTVAGALTTAMGFFPAGLGMREILVAAISPLVGLAAAAGLAAAVVDRFFRFAIVGVTAGTIMLWDRIRLDDVDSTPASEPGPYLDR